MVGKFMTSNESVKVETWYWTLLVKHVCKMSGTDLGSAGP